MHQIAADYRSGNAGASIRGLLGAAQPVLTYNSLASTRRMRYGYGAFEVLM